MELERNPINKWEGASTVSGRFVFAFDGYVEGPGKASHAKRNSSKRELVFPVGFNEGWLAQKPQRRK